MTLTRNGVRAALSVNARSASASTHGAFDQIPRGGDLTGYINAVWINDVNDRSQPEAEEASSGLDRRQSPWRHRRARARSDREP